MAEPIDTDVIRRRRTAIGKEATDRLCDEVDRLRAALRDLLTEWTNTGHSRDPHSDPPSCWKCAEYWPCPAERARLALAAEAQP